MVFHVVSVFAEGLHLPSQANPHAAAAAAAATKNCRPNSKALLD